MVTHLGILVPRNPPYWTLPEDGAKARLERKTETEIGKERDEGTDSEAMCVGWVPPVPATFYPSVLLVNKHLQILPFAWTLQVYQVT